MHANMLNCSWMGKMNCCVSHARWSRSLTGSIATLRFTLYALRFTLATPTHPDYMRYFTKTTMGARRAGYRYRALAITAIAD